MDRSSVIEGVAATSPAPHHPAARRRPQPQLIAGLLAAMLACSGSPPAVQLSERWPAQAGDYDEVTRQWTRSGALRAGFSDHFTELARVAATLKSPAWRAAHIEHLTRQNHLSQQTRAELRAAEEKAASEHHEVLVFLTTHDDRLNDLGKNQRSSWRLTLVNDLGQEAVASSIQRDRRPRNILRALFPHLDDFAKPYLVRFPPDLRVFGERARFVLLRLASAHGTIELRWQTE
jgi:hypothetical protein